jgi:hypothetical protein
MRSAEKRCNGKGSAIGSAVYVSTAATQSPSCEVEARLHRELELSLVAGKNAGKSRFRPVDRPSVDL